MPRPQGHFGIARSVRLSVRPLSVPWRSCLGDRHAGCRQLSHPPATRDVRTADPSADGRRSTAIFATVELPSAGGISRLAASGAIPRFWSYYRPAVADIRCRITTASCWRSPRIERRPRLRRSAHRKTSSRVSVRTRCQPATASCSGPSTNHAAKWSATNIITDINLNKITPVSVFLCCKSDCIKTADIQFAPEFNAQKLSHLHQSAACHRICRLVFTSPEQPLDKFIYC